MDQSFENYDEESKYRKKTDSNISKSQRKTKHKHRYKGCLIKYSFKLSTFSDASAKRIDT